jgi:release factor glutamine methyltransferase
MLTESSIVERLRGAGCVFAEDEARLLLSSAATSTELTRMVARRIGGEPLEHIVGWVDFCGLRIAVDPGVFVPRQRTQLLVRQAVALAAPRCTVVDLACGCGAIGVALAAQVEGIAVSAVDISADAVACASRNLPFADVYCGDLFDPLPISLRGKVDLLVANLPYVPTSAVAMMPPEARLHEPLAALDGGSDGLEVLRRVANAAPDWLAPGGHVLIEIGAAQADAALAALAALALLSPIVVSDDELGATVVIGERVASGSAR